MKSAINQWAFPESMPTTEAMSLAKRLGFQAFECVFDEKTRIPLDATEKDITALRKHADTLGLGLMTTGSGLGWAYPLTSIDATVRNKGKEITRRTLQLSHWLGAEALLVVPGIVDSATRYDIALENALDSIRELVSAAEQFKVALGVENVWNKLFMSPVELRDFIDQFESDYVGAYFDTGNCVLFAYPEHWIRILGSRIKAVHLKDYRAGVGTLDGFVMLMEGDVNWPEVIAALRDIGYAGPLTAEYGPYRHSLDTMLNHVQEAIQRILTL